MATFFDVAVIQEFVIKSSIYDSYLLVLQLLLNNNVVILNEVGTV